MTHHFRDPSRGHSYAIWSILSATTPTVSTSTTARFGATEANALVNGVGSSYFEVKGSKLIAGRFFDDTGVMAMEQDAVIDENTAKTLFAAPSSVYCDPCYHAAEIS